MKKTAKKSSAKKPATKSSKSTSGSASGSASKSKSTTGKPKVTKVAANSKAGGSAKSAKNPDIIQLILEDHKALKQLIKTMKDSEASLSERQEAFEEFAPLLVTHAKPEEETLYVRMKKEEDMREDGFEGDVEHALADQLLEEIKRTDDEDLWSARVKVLAELVEHHIEEEESDMLPEFKKEIDADERLEMAEAFLQLKDKYVNLGGKDTVRESTLQSSAR